MSNVEVKGIQLHYIEDGSGQPVIFVHGGVDDYRAWNSQIGAFAQRYHAIAYSSRYAFPNWRIGDRMDNTIENNVVDLAALIIKLGLAPTHIIAHSWGGLTAIFCALRHPELVRTLVLGEPPLLPLLVKNPKNPLDVLSFLLRRPSTARTLIKFANRAVKPAQEAFRRGDPEQAVRVFENGVLGREGAFDQLTPSIRAMLMDNSEELKGALDDSIIPPFTFEDARRISAPTLLVRGELSPIWFRRIVDILAKWFPNNEVVTIPGVSHNLQMGKPEEFNEKVLEFLAKHS